LAIKNEELKQQMVEYEAARDDLKAESERLRGEIDRLNSLLETITNSRTWRLREFIRGLVGHPQ
jgi:cell division protein FtsB